MGVVAGGFFNILTVLSRLVGQLIRINAIYQGQFKATNFALKRSPSFNRRQWPHLGRSPVQRDFLRLYNYGLDKVCGRGFRDVYQPAGDTGLSYSANRKIIGGRDLNAIAHIEWACRVTALFLYICDNVAKKIHQERKPTLFGFAEKWAWLMAPTLTYC